MKIVEYLSLQECRRSFDYKTVLSRLQEKLTQKQFSTRLEQSTLHFQGPNKLYGNLFRTPCWCFVGKGIAEITTQADGCSYLSFNSSFRWKLLAWDILTRFGTICVVMCLAGTILANIETPYRTPLYFFIILAFSAVIGNYVVARFIVRRTVKKAIADARGSNTHQP